MKKRSVIFGLALLSMTIGLAACGQSGNPTTPTSTTGMATSTDTASYNVVFNSNGGTEVATQTVKSGSKATEPTNISKKDATNNNCEFKGWYTDEYFSKKFDFNSEIHGDITLYAKWFGYEEVVNSFQAVNLDSGKITNKQVGQFKVSGEVRGRTKAWVNPTDKNDTKEWTKSLKNGKIEFTAPGDGKVVIYAQNGSGDAKTQTVTFKPESDMVESITISGTDAVAPYGGGSPVVAIEREIMADETYTISYVSGTVDFFEIDIIYTAKESDVNGIIVDSVEPDYLVGEEFDTSRVRLLATYENGKIAEIDTKNTNLKFDQSKYNKNESGTYKIGVQYGNFEKQEFDVNVWAVDSLDLGFNSTYLSKERTSAGNSQYINGKVKTIYLTNENLDTKYLSVYANCKIGNRTKSFLLNNREFAKNLSIGGLITTSTGVKQVEVKYNDGKEVTKTYDVTVVAIDTVKDANDNYLFNVNAAYTGLAGAKSETLGNQFKTIGEALEYIELADLDPSSKKILNIEAGTYTEKLEINIPNLTINGAGQDTTLIEWDSLWGIPDEGGFVQNTDSVQTVSVREKAVNCTMNNLTISNWWNSEARFTSDEANDLLVKYGLKIGDKVNEHRAVALLVQADKFVMESCGLLGYQDTVQFQKGRQYLHNCYIAGRTDFIFGTNNTTLFEECEIKSIVSGGYNTAFMGCSKGEEDSVAYGAIFYKCNLTKDSSITDSNTALGRTWGAYANVAYIECTMASHVSTKASTGASASERYVAMQNSTPTTPTVKFVEYGNTGAGAISASQAGVTYLTEEAAALYHDMATIFGTTNGHVTYSDTWNPKA